MGGNLDAFNDILSWPSLETGQRYALTWKNSALAKEGSGHAAMARELEQMLQSCHPSNVASVGVTDAGLKKLAEWKSLQRVILYETRVTEGGLTELEIARPDLIKILMRGVALEGRDGCRALAARGALSWRAGWVR
jgi:hypothetical protein